MCTVGSLAEQPRLSVDDEGFNQLISAIINNYKETHFYSLEVLNG
jgi:hypothetical protein